MNLAPVQVEHAHGDSMRRPPPFDGTRIRHKSLELLGTNLQSVRTDFMAVGHASETSYHKAILLVEDEPLIRMDTADSLREGGYFVQEAAHARAAISSLQSKPEIDLLFTDVNLGKGMNGVDLAVWALTYRPNIAVLVTTGGALITCLPPALGPILAKPYTVIELLNRVRQSLA